MVWNELHPAKAARVDELLELCEDEDVLKKLLMAAKRRMANHGCSGPAFKAMQYFDVLDPTFSASSQTDIRMAAVRLLKKIRESRGQNPDWERGIR